MNVEELDLVRKMIAGEREAFERFSDAYLPALYRFARNRLGGDRELTREIVQMTVCKVLPNLKSFRGDAALLTWMGAICRNEIAMHFRRLSRRPREVEWTLGTEEHAKSSEVVFFPSIEENLIQSERANLVHMVLELLPPHYGQALEWKYIESLSVKEMAARLEMGTKAVESLLTRARQAFRGEYDRHLQDVESPRPTNPANRRVVSES